MLVEPLLKVEHLKKIYPIRKNVFQRSLGLQALNDISFEVYPGETLSIVGESGCGKSTLAKLILHIEPVTSGKMLFQQKDITFLSAVERKAYWKQVQMVFQNPYSSLNPRWKVGRIIGEPLQLNTKFSPSEIREKVLSLMNQVGLSSEHFDRYPHQFSGGQRQRIGIARALCLRPKLLVCDEPVSALDVSIQSQVLNLLMDLQQQGEIPLTTLFISHDLSVVEHISDRILVMYLGKIVESGKREQIFSRPKHPYTEALLSAIPKLNLAEKKPRIVLTGEIPSPLNPPSGCSFRTRCPYVRSECSKISMELLTPEPEHQTACPFF
ncbi:MAG: dipeptide ABC transporter ATP-binding protein [Planctomycetota bacterium]